MELKLLIDAVSSSRFITQRKSQSLARKIISRTSEHEQNELKHNIYATNCIKSNNECLLYIIDTVNEVIYSKNKIAFQCWDYTLEKNPEKWWRDIYNESVCLILEWGFLLFSWIFWETWQYFFIKSKSYLLCGVIR